MSGALEGLKVFDLSRVLGGPYCGQMLADHGAEVIKIEPPQGDETRLWGPPFNAEGISAYFSGINRNKRTIALDLSDRTMAPRSSRSSRRRVTRPACGALPSMPKASRPISPASTATSAPLLSIFQIGPWRRGHQDRAAAG